MIQIKKYRKFLIIIALFQVVGCLPTKHTLVYHQQDFNPNDIDVITVFPIITASPMLDAQSQAFAKDFQSLLLEELKKKGYTFNILNNTDTLGNIQPTMIPFLDSGRIREIGPNDAQWILMPTAIDGDVVCYLYQKATGKLMWEGSVSAINQREGIKVLMKRFPSNNRSIN